MGRWCWAGWSRSTRNESWRALLLFPSAAATISVFLCCCRCCWLASLLYYPVASVAEYRTIEGGAGSMAWQLRQELLSSSSSGAVPRIAVQIAANSGRPGGACGNSDGSVSGVHDRHRTQEESVVSNWLVTEYYASLSSSSSSSSSSRAAMDFDERAAAAAWNAIFRSTIHGRWGMVRLRGSTSPETLQGVDYVHTTDSEDYADAWVVRRAAVSAQRQRSRATIVSGYRELRLRL